MLQATGALGGAHSLGRARTRLFSRRRFAAVFLLEVALLSLAIFLLAQLNIGGGSSPRTQAPAHSDAHTGGIRNTANPHRPGPTR